MSGAAVAVAALVAIGPVAPGDLATYQPSSLSDPWDRRPPVCVRVEGIAPLPGGAPGAHVEAVDPGNGARWSGGHVPLASLKSGCGTVAAR